MTHDERVLAVIIGRAGSKGLPGKNALPLCGKPMICHSIGTALGSSTVDRTIVSTDGSEIAAAARAMNIEVIARPASLADDRATVDSAVRHAVCEAEFAATIIVILYANVPVRPADLIDRAVRMLVESGADSVQSYCDVGKYHPHWMVRLEEGGRVVAHHANGSYRRQDLPPLRIPDGGVIAVRRESLFVPASGDPHAFLGADRRGIETRPGEVVDVDDAQDFLFAESILSRRTPMPAPVPAPSPAPSPELEQPAS